LHISLKLFLLGKKNENFTDIEINMKKKRPCQDFIYNARFMAIKITRPSLCSKFGAILLSIVLNGFLTQAEGIDNECPVPCVTDIQILSSP